VSADAVRQPLPDGRQVWEVRGTLWNKGARDEPVPPVHIHLLDAASRPVGRWLVRADADRLAPGARLAFATAVTPPAAAARLRVSVAPPSPARL
jgi:hypothetical protein